jgi:hypothetical protein
MKEFKDIFHDTISGLPMQEFEKRTFNLKRYLKNEYI